jgi:chromosome segregation ATPase
LSRAGDLWLDVETGLRELMQRHRAGLTHQLKTQLAEDRQAAARLETERFQSRQGELSQLITETRMERLEREIDLLTQERNQGVLFDPDNTLARLRDSAESKEAELRRLRLHIEDLREQLNRERDRVLHLLIPRRFALRGEAQCVPVAVEIRFREARP